MAETSKNGCFANDVEDDPYFKISFNEIKRAPLVIVLHYWVDRFNLIVCLEYNLVECTAVQIKLHPTT
jgi:hypothetical protein